MPKYIRKEFFVISFIHTSDLKRDETNAARFQPQSLMRVLRQGRCKGKAPKRLFKIVFLNNN